MDSKSKDTQPQATGGVEPRSQSFDTKEEIPAVKKPYSVFTVSEKWTIVVIAAVGGMFR